LNPKSTDNCRPTHAPAADLIAACVTVLAEMKHLYLSAADCCVIAGRVASGFTPEELDAFMAVSPSRVLIGCGAGAAVEPMNLQLAHGHFRSIANAR